MGRRKPLEMSDLGAELRWEWEREQRMLDGEEMVEIAWEKTCDMDAKRLRRQMGRRTARTAGTAWVQRHGWKWVGEEAAGEPGWGATWFERWCADGVGARERTGNGWEKKRGKEGKGRLKEGKGRERKGKGRVGKEAAGDERAWLRGRLRTGNGRENAWTAADGVGAREWLEMGGEKKPLVMSELGCADGCGRANGCGKLRGRLRTSADGVGAREWLEMGGLVKRAWLRGRRTGNGCGELRGRLRTAWVQRSG